MFVNAGTLPKVNIHRPEECYTLWKCYLITALTTFYRSDSLCLSDFNPFHLQKPYLILATVLNESSVDVCCQAKCLALLKGHTSTVTFCRRTISKPLNILQCTSSFKELELFLNCTTLWECLHNAGYCRAKITSVILINSRCFNPKDCSHGSYRWSFSYFINPVILYIIIYVFIVIYHFSSYLMATIYFLINGSYLLS